MDKTLQDIRTNYALKTLDESDLYNNPILQFKSWFDDALSANVVEPNAMTLSTSVDGKVFSRIVLLKEIDESGFIFYTNYESAKAKEMLINPHIAISFLWKEIQRQVRIEGTVSKISEERSTAYAHSRPRGSQIGAWASNQSEVIQNRQILEEKQAELTAKFENLEIIPKPSHWGGYLITPSMVEFWQGRPSRLHDRLRYRKTREQEWIVERLAP